jgi:predicted DNA-binding protein YlxM (UPF0122 family)
MERLIKPSEYAKDLGISRQAVYAKIKKGILKSKTVDGKLYIVVDDTTKEKHSDTKKTTTTKPKDNTSKSNVSYEELLKAKDETIDVLKGTIKDLKESNKEISTTLRGEIDLLKEAFYEMRTMYSNQIEYASKSVEAIEVIEDDVDIHSEMISIKKFCKIYNIKDKKMDKLKKVFKKLYKNGDNRFDMIDGKLRVDINQSFDDILE